MLMLLPPVLLRSDLRDLETDIKMYLSMGKDQEYWEALMCVCQDSIEDEQFKRSGRTDKYGLHQSVQAEVAAMFEGKTRTELVDLEAQIRQKIDAGLGAGRGSIDVEYWEGLSQAVTVFKAKAFLKEMHADMLRKRLQQLKADALADESDEGPEPELVAFEEVGDAQPTKKRRPRQLEEDEESSDGDDSFEPPLLQSLPDGERAVDEETDKLELENQRRMIVEQRQREERAKMGNGEEAERQEEERNAMSQAGMTRFAMSSEELYKREAAKEVGKDEKVFSSSEEVMVEPTGAYWWHDKFRPRKPRYFNRVKTGYEWNKYNQTHYDKENPPPKIVQGYKFNVFYPDLIDSTKPPTYVLENTPEKDYCIIRFTAGPPYEDIAFKIVKKEWEYNHKRGYKCVFDRGVLHLYFNFRRYFYRR